MSLTSYRAAPPRVTSGRTAASPTGRTRQGTTASAGHAYSNFARPCEPQFDATMRRLHRAAAPKADLPPLQPCRTASRTDGVDGRGGSIHHMG